MEALKFQSPDPANQKPSFAITTIQVDLDYVVSTMTNLGLPQ